MKYLRTHENYTKFRDILDILEKDLDKEIIEIFVSFKLDRLKIKSFSLRSGQRLKSIFLYFHDKELYIEINDEEEGGIAPISLYDLDFKLKILKSLEELTPEDIEKQRIDQEAKKFNL